MPQPVGKAGLNGEGALRSLADLPVGTRAVIARIPLDDPGTAAELAALRILPGEPVEVVEVIPLHGPLLVQTAGGVYALGRRAGGPHRGLEVLTTNYPGATVEVNAAVVRLDGRVLTLVDLPGIYCLTCSSGDQCAAREALLENPPDVVVAILDATNLARNLFLVLQLIDLGFRVVVALNLADAAEHAGIRIDAQQLQDLLGVPVIPTVATRGHGLREVLAEAVRASGRPPVIRHRYGPRVGGGGGGPAAVAVARERHALADRIATKVTVSPDEFRGRAAWRVAVRPATGIPLLLVVLAAIFAGLFWGGGALAALVDGAWATY